MHSWVLRIFYFQNGGRLPSSIFIFSQFLWKIQICAYCYVVVQRLNDPQPSYCAFSIFKMAAVRHPDINRWLQSESAIIFRNCGHPYEHPDLWPRNSPDLNPVDYNNWRNESTRQKCKWKSANTYKDDKHILTANHQCGNVAPALGTSVDGIIGCGSSGSSGRIFSQTV